MIPDESVGATTPTGGTVASIRTRRISHEELRDAQEVADAFARTYGDADHILARLREQMERPRG